MLSGLVYLFVWGDYLEGFGGVGGLLASLSLSSLFFFSSLLLSSFKMGSKEKDRSEHCTEKREVFLECEYPFLRSHLLSSSSFFLLGCFPTFEGVYSYLDFYYLSLFALDVCSYCTSIAFLLCSGRGNVSGLVQLLQDRTLYTSLAFFCSSSVLAWVDSLLSTFFTVQSGVWAVSVFRRGRTLSIAG